MKTLFTFKKENSFMRLLPLLALLPFCLPVDGQTLHVVEVRDTQFDPATLEITAGDTVEWRNVQGYHNVNGTRTTYPSNPESFGNNAGNDWTFRHVFATAGSYSYQCDPHVSLGMTGTVNVLEGEENGGQFLLSVDFMSMNPHVGQDFYLALVEKGTGMEVGRADTTADVEFTIEISGIESGKSYHVDFWADHNRNGVYDAPPADHAWRIELTDVQGDTTLVFTHNTNFTDIMWKNLLTVEFSGMNPHTGQDLYLAVKDAVTGMEVGRTHAVADSVFSLSVPGIEPGQSYHVDFWADFNNNGMYDAPPTDHAWRIELNDVMGDTTLTFIHNTDFTDIMWKNLLTVEFSGMNPHIGQHLYMAVKNTATGIEAGRAHAVADSAFTVHVPGIETGQSYHVDFWVDFNENSRYDAPPADHAWRLELNDVMGDTTLTFMHNTDFTDIMWKHLLTVEFSGMNPHMGQDLYLAVRTSDGMEVGRAHVVADSVFSVMVPGIETGKSYHIDFWADFNENGMYDAPPTDHAWRIELNDVMGDTTLTFIHNTDFTDIMWKNLLTVEFSGMNPHIGQHIYISVRDTVTGKEAGRAHAVADSVFTMQVPGIEKDKSYHVDIWVDFNENGRYDAPPTDHAWRLDLNEVMGDTTLMFMHNTDFTDIEWKHILTVQFSGMTPHIGQLFELYVTNTEDGMIKDTVIIEELTSADFEVTSASLMSGHSYTINFWADFNDNGVYDAPPVDHAWQIALDSIGGDTTITFVHNTDFTDIFPATSVNQPENNRFRMYPNPASGSVTIETGHSEAAAYRLAVYDMAGRLTKVDARTFSNQIKFDVQPLNRGIYFIELKRSGERTVLKLIKD
jgi:plastocyanin